MTSCKWLALWEIQNSNVKFVKKKLLEGTNLKCMWKMSIKNLQKYKCDECGKHFILNIGLKRHITAVHEKRFNCDQCGKNLAREFNLKVLTQIFHEKDFEFNCEHWVQKFH